MSLHSISGATVKERRRLTVLQVVPTLETGGAERTAVDIGAALSTRGDRALIATEGGRLADEARVAGAEIVDLPVASKNPLTMARNVGQITAVIEREHVDIVHARSRAPAWSCLAAARRTGRPFVTTYHGAYNENGSFKSLYNSVMARGDVVIANSAWTAELIAARFPRARNTTRIVHRGTDLGQFNRSTISSERREALKAAWGLGGSDTVLLQLARLTEWKGQRVVIDAMARLASRRPGLVAVLAGDEQGREGYRAELERLIRSHDDLTHRVRLVGHCEDVAGALSIADLCVVASTEPEAFGRAAVEAQAMGVPTIVSDLGAVRETVLAPPEIADAGRTGWRVPAGDAGALARHIETALLLSAADREALADRAVAHARTFSLASMIIKTLSIYDHLAGLS